MKFISHGPSPGLVIFTLGRSGCDNQGRHSSSPITKEVAQHLRTLIFNSDQLSNTIFSDFKCLHVLTLSDSLLEELPKTINKLIHLRNLNISHTNIRHLPEWIDALLQLQTLRAECYLEKLPSTIKYLINLRNLHVPSVVHLPAEIGRLTSLQTIPTFFVRNKNGYKIDELGSLNNLKGCLKIVSFERVHDKEEAEKANLSKKSKLSELHLAWNTNTKEVERNDDHENVLEGLQPHSNLKKLVIWRFNGKRFPVWTLKMAVRNELQGSWVGLNQLEEIKLNRCKCEEVPMLGHLPNLKSLYFNELSNVKCINSSFYGIRNETGIVFPALETLSLIDMPSLKEWEEAESGSTSEVKVFPHLQSLKISKCNQLMKAPTHFSSCLKSLEISWMTDNYLPLLIIYMSKFTSLTDLVFEGTNGLESLPDELFYINPNLVVLKIRECPKLREIPDGLQTLNSLKIFIIHKCPDLERIWCQSRGSLASLFTLDISECHGLMDFPCEMVESSSAPVLKSVMLKGLSSLKNLPRVIECLGKSPDLRELRIIGVSKFMSSTSVEVWHFPKLLELEIDVSMEGSWETSFATKKTVDRILQACNWDLLEKLSLTGMEIWEFLPESIQHFTSLGRLELNNFGIEELPEWFDRCISHTKPWFTLKLSECKRLRCLPSTYAMRRLIGEGKLAITGCPELFTC